MEAITDLLDQLEDAVEFAKGLPFSNKVQVDKEIIIGIIHDMRLVIPDEMRHAQNIINDRQRIIDEAHSDADRILAEAEEDAKFKVNEHEVYRRASEKASDTEEEGRKFARQMRAGAFEHADSLLKKAEEEIRALQNNISKYLSHLNTSLDDTLDELYENRQELRGTKNSDTN